jgi:colicin import membrane protein
MTARSPSAYLSSATLHAAAVVLLLAAAWVTSQQTRPPVKIFDLVAGEGDNWAATEAPALGTPDGVKLQVPATAEPVQRIAEPVPRIAEPAPAPPEPSPVQAAPIPEAAPVPPTTAKTTDGKVPDLVRTVKRTAAKVEQKMAQKQRMEDALAAEKARKDAAAAKKIMTKEQYDKLYGNKANPAGKAGATKIARVDAKGIAGGVVGGSTANTVGGAGGKALSREEASVMEGYFSYLKQKLEQAHEPPVGVSDKLSVRVEFMLAVDGSISQVRVVRSSGNKDFDQSVLEAFKRVRSIGTRPDGRSEPITLEFNTRDDE